MRCAQDSRGIASRPPKSSGAKPRRKDEVQAPRKFRERPFSFTLYDMGHRKTSLSRRALLQGAAHSAALLAIAPGLGTIAAGRRLGLQAEAGMAQAFPLESVRLLPSPYLTAL